MDLDNDGIVELHELKAFQAKKVRARACRRVCEFVVRVSVPVRVHAGACVATVRVGVRGRRCVRYALPMCGVPCLPVGLCLCGCTQAAKEARAAARGEAGDVDVAVAVRMPTSRSEQQPGGALVTKVRAAAAAAAAALMLSVVARGQPFLTECLTCMCASDGATACLSPPRSSRLPAHPRDHVPPCGGIATTCLLCACASA
jgi:hypothetical protein